MTQSELTSDWWEHLADLLGDAADAYYDQLYVSDVHLDVSSRIQLVREMGHFSCARDYAISKARSTE